MSIYNIVRRNGLGAITTLLVCIVLGTGGAYGNNGMQKQLEDGFNAMASHTNPRIVNGSMRGQITGGSFTVRHKVTQIDQMIGLQLPSVNIGCGGWDIFGGSFSVISSDQVVAMLRAIAASAVAYAFKLALCTISDKVCQQMELLWKDSTFFNMMGKSSCEIGHNFVNWASNGRLTAMNQKASNEAVETGFKDDNAEATNNMKADTPAVEAAKRKENDAAALQAIIEGNHIWNALKAHGTSHWTAFGGDKFIEDVMSVSGTIIMCAPDVAGCPSNGGQATYGQKDVVVLTRAPVMGLMNLVKGPLDHSELLRWECNDNTHCLNPSKKTIHNFVGMEEKLRKALLGETEAMGQGLIGRYAWLGAHTSADNWLITAGGDYVAMAFSLANDDENRARAFIEQFIEIMAAEITHRIVNEALTKVLAATSLYEGGGAVDAQKMVRAAQVQLNVELGRFKDRAQEKTRHFEYFKLMRDARAPFSAPNAR